MFSSKNKNLQGLKEINMLFNKFILTKERGSYLPPRGIVRSYKFKIQNSKVKSQNLGILK